MFGAGEDDGARDGAVLQQIGEQVTHDDRALMFLLKLEDGQFARAEAREERREQRAHELRMKELEIEAKRPAAKPIPEVHASAAHPAPPAEAESPSPINDLPAGPADIAPPRVVEVVHKSVSSLAPLPLQREWLGEGVEKTHEA